MTDSRPNILFITLDQLRADIFFDLVDNDPAFETMRSLAADGVSFRKNFCAITPCGPSRASLLTGLYAMNHRSVRNGTPLAADHTNLALELRKAGREPLLFGYTDATPDPRGLDPNDPSLTDYEGLLPGFTEVARMRADDNADWRRYLIALGYDAPDAASIQVPQSPDPSRDARINDPALFHRDYSETAYLTDQLLNHLKLLGDKSWSVHLSYIKPHPPFAAAAPYNTFCTPEAAPKPAHHGSLDAEMAVHPVFKAFFSKAGQNYQTQLPGTDAHTLTPEQTQEIRAVYIGLIKELDDHIGRIIAYLKETGQYDRTLIVLTADHGEMLGDHLMWGKESVYERAFHTPMIIRDPKRRQTAGRSVEQITQSIDVVPTILDWLDLKIPYQLDGQSLLPLLTDQDASSLRDYAYMELDFANPARTSIYETKFGLPFNQLNVCILREHQYKYIHFNGGLPPLLFDMDADPNEMTNLAEQPEHRDTIARMTRALLDHRMTYADRRLSGYHATADGMRHIDDRTS
ncbi:sulfatase-like hydrolase/transferase [Coralliovum pocilloporae]|uniref:sulfatase-like hydrolase/transferase n=1 Tax=Coralliovum pocilloporae TaxID=3066369 RepID=UPI003306B5C6